MNRHILILTVIALTGPSLTFADSNRYNVTLNHYFNFEYGSNCLIPGVTINQPTNINNYSWGKYGSLPPAGAASTVTIDNQITVELKYYKAKLKDGLFMEYICKPISATINIPVKLLTNDLSKTNTIYISSTDQQTYQQDKQMSGLPILPQSSKCGAKHQSGDIIWKVCHQ